MDEKVQELLENLNSELESDFSRFRDLPHNPDSKGSSYEEVLKNLLDKYFGGSYTFYTKPAVLDSNLEVFDKFDTSRGENEFDVAGMFRQADPKVVFNVGEMTYIPLPGMAFVFEVKSKLTKTSLEDDLDKLSKLKNLIQNEETQASAHIKYDGALSRPALCLIYDKYSISDESFSKILQENESWDLLLNVEHNRLHINDTVPLASRELKEKYGEDYQKKFLTLSEGVANFVIIMSQIVNTPIGSINVSEPIRALIHQQSTLMNEKSDTG